MAYRLLEVILPPGKNVRPDELDMDGVVDSWQVEVGGERTVLKLLVTMEASESLLDHLSKRFEGQEGFRVVITDIAGLVPVEEEAPEKESPQPASRLRVSREELYMGVASSAEINHVYLAMVALSTLIAAFGFANGNPLPSSEPW